MTVLFEAALVSTKGIFYWQNSHQQTSCRRYPYEPCQWDFAVLEINSALHHKPNDSNPALTNDRPWLDQRARRGRRTSGRRCQPHSALKKIERFSLCLICMARPVETIYRTVLISNIWETCLLNPISVGKSILVLSVLMAVKCQGLLPATRQIQADGTSLINKHGNKLGKHHGEQKTIIWGPHR